MTVGHRDIFIREILEHKHDVISLKLHINPDCSILAGHFPGQPVVPGACMVQLLKDIIEDTLNTSLSLKKADHLKFISMLIPCDDQELHLEIKYKKTDNDIFNAVAKLICDGVISFKFQGSFISV